VPDCVAPIGINRAAANGSQLRGTPILSLKALVSANQTDESVESKTRAVEIGSKIASSDFLNKIKYLRSCEAA